MVAISPLVPSNLFLGCSPRGSQRTGSCPDPPHGPRFPQGADYILSKNARVCVLAHHHLVCELHPSLCGRSLAAGYRIPKTCYHPQATTPAAAQDIAALPRSLWALTDSRNNLMMLPRNVVVVVRLATCLSSLARVKRLFKEGV